MKPKGGLIGVYAMLWSKIPEIIERSEDEVQGIIENTLLNVENSAKGASRVRTGSMRAGWTSEMIGEHEGVVYNLVDYTVYNEYGTRHMAAQPMLAPAVEEHEPAMLEALKEVYSA